MNRTIQPLLALLLITLPTRAADPDPMPGKCQTLLDHWKPKFDEEKINAIVAPPYVIAGDAAPAQLRAYRDHTILAATRCLQKQLFKQQPAEPILILLFETEVPYKRLSKKWFNANDVPHYGYFRHDNIMLMNVGTGTGTLVHELTHALIKPDFPTVPSWFNEGIASLYEQCSFGPNDTLRGLENWRLPALQKAIKADKLRPLSELIADDDFYNADRTGLNYAQARYLMFYLQEKKLLTRYYETFRDTAKADPTGLDALKKVIGPLTLADFEKQWREWVISLRFEAR